MAYFYQTRPLTQITVAYHSKQQNKSHLSFQTKVTEIRNGLFDVGAYYYLA